ncbi:uncharacterized protein LOC142597896 [Dermatophagoides farinae]|uniref:uncharacterized protein LOC142597896 n=1 Tax=Dermatophagoides farinae TaxID=6954 RepID=UPI003F5E0A71
MLITQTRHDVDFYKHVEIQRDRKINHIRSKIPIINYESAIVELVRENLFSLVSGGTGCGKSTQIPQFLIECGFNFSVSDEKNKTKILKICMTQPRRAAVESITNRLKFELGSFSENVSSHIRNKYDKCSSDEYLVIMTEGILLNIIQSDILLSNFSVIILDEFHERSLSSDILFGMLTYIVRLRAFLWNKNKINIPPLRVLLMSATYKLFGKPILDFDALLNDFSFQKLEIEDKIFPVAVHYAKKTVKNNLPAVASKIKKIHNELPAGSILAFLPGKKEIQFVHKLLSGVNGKNNEISFDADIDNITAAQLEGFADSSNNILPQSDDEFNDSIGFDFDEDKNNKELSVDSDIGSIRKKIKTGEAASNETLLETDPDSNVERASLDEDIKKKEYTEWKGADGNGTLTVYEFYSGINEQTFAKIFNEPKPSERIVILATNVAETSLTLPNVRYVVDSGYMKYKTYNQLTSVGSIKTVNISKSNAVQRTGRAGRVGRGHCYRMYSAETFSETMKNFMTPLLLSTPLESIFLQN